MADSTYGFKFRYRLSGGPPTIQDLYCADSETLTKGDMATLEVGDGEIDLAATNDTTLLGAILESATGVDSTTQFKVITDPDAVYGVVDANARQIGDTLDISGTTGAMTVTSSTNADLTVVANSSASQETLVMITPGEHAFHQGG